MYRLRVQVKGTIWTQLIALGFALGSSAHALGFVLLSTWGIKWYGPTYPAWRHLVMASVDLLIVWIALRRPSWLVVALALFLVEQLVVSGFHLEATPFFVLIAVVVAAWEKWFRHPREDAGVQTT